MLLSVLLLLVPFGNSAGGHTSKFLQGGGMPLQRSRVEARGWASEGLESSDKVEKKRCRSRLSTGENHEIMEGCRNAVEEKPAIAPDNEERTFIFDSFDWGKSFNAAQSNACWDKSDSKLLPMSCKRAVKSDVSLAAASPSCTQEARMELTTHNTVLATSRAFSSKARRTPQTISLESLSQTPFELLRAARQLP